MDIRPCISFIGAGNVAWHLASRYHEAGCRVMQVWSRQRAHAGELAERVGAEAVVSLKELVTADVIVVAVRDDAIGEVVRQIDFGDALVVHTAGSVDADVLSGVSSRYGVLWPVQSLVRGQRCGDIPFVVEGVDEPTAAAIEQMARIISSHVYRLDGRQRRRAHFAATLVSNFGNAINALAEEYMVRGGADFALLRPLIETTAGKVAGGGLWDKQTGAAARHDEHTMAAHRELLAGDDELLQLYDLMTKIIEKRC
ncbi:MAG: DUF2520 domain-containing protein [Bacteroidales bacterium]|nr:DUF2520 domain-containing protein [Bacteroidales bacterium]